MDISASQTAALDGRVPWVRTAEDVPSFEAFYREHVASLAGALAVTLNDGELAADAVNEAMTRAYQRWSKISRYDNPAAWVYRVGLNWSLSWKRRRRREQDRPVRWTALAAESAEAALRDDTLDRALDALSVDRRAVIVCRIFFDWSVEQTAEALGIAPGTVKSRLARALSELKESTEREPQTTEGASRDL